MPTAKMTATIRSHVYHLRTMLARESSLSGTGDLLTTEPIGYRLRTSADQIDAVRFERLVNQGRMMLDRGEPADASVVLRQALALWRGQRLSTSPADGCPAGMSRAWLKAGVRATELRLEADLRLGRHRDLVAELHETILANEFAYAGAGEAVDRSRGRM